jgi:hypothetical protein
MNNTYNIKEDLRNAQNILSEIDNNYRDLYVRLLKEPNLSEGTRKSLVRLGEIICRDFVSPSWPDILENN